MDGLDGAEVKDNPVKAWTVISAQTLAAVVKEEVAETATHSDGGGTTNLKELTEL